MQEVRGSNPRSSTPVHRPYSNSGPMTIAPARGSLRGISWSNQVIGSLPVVSADLQCQATDLLAGPVGQGSPGGRRGPAVLECAPGDRRPLPGACGYGSRRVAKPAPCAELCCSGWRRAEWTVWRGRMLGLAVHRRPRLLYAVRAQAQSGMSTNSARSLTGQT